MYFIVEKYDLIVENWINGYCGYNIFKIGCNNFGCKWLIREYFVINKCDD